MVKFLFIFYFSFFIFHFSLPPAAFALENFTTAYDVTYTVNENGITNAKFDVFLTNTSSKVYASSYKIILGFVNIANVSAYDPDGKINPRVISTDNEVGIELTFNKKVVGINKKLPFTFSFDTTEVAQKQGEVFEINIPGISRQNKFTDFKVHVKVPSSFGAPSYIKPNIKTKNLDFTKEQLGESGISIAFGNKQYYRFKLAYHLKNSHVFPIKTEIALPPKTGYQTVTIGNISPKPLNIRQDGDGNYLAQYSLLPGKKIDVIATGRVQVVLKPKKETLSPQKTKQYLAQKPYWENSEKIKELGQKLKTPRAIYQYVWQTLTYDFSRVINNSPRLGAKEVLLNPSSAVCLEFTDLFIAIARSAGIPARELNGYAYTQNQKQRPLSLVKDILHAWPEYYDQQQETWIMVDPTWANTTGGIDYFNTFDLDHIVFVIKGSQSDYPIPAGGYKPEGAENVKDVEVSFSDPFEPQVSEKIFADLPKSRSATTIITPAFLTNAGFTIIILIIATGTWYLLFYRRKR